MTLLEHFKDPNFWHIFTEEMMKALIFVGFLVVVFWLIDKIKSKPDLTTRLAEQSNGKRGLKNDR